MLSSGVNFTAPIHAFFETVDAGVIEISDAPYSFGHLPDIDMDNFMVCVGNDKKIGTDGIGTCFAICAQGRNPEGVAVIALAHKSSCVAINDAFHALKKEMVRVGCLKMTIQTVVIGGESPTFDEPEGCIEEEKEFLRLGSKGKIREALFNFAKGEEESLSVVVTAEKIYVSKKNLYTPVDETIDQINL